MLKRLAFVLLPVLLGAEVSTIKVKTTKETNGGTPMYVLIKETDKTDFLIEDYHKITGQNFFAEEESAGKTLFLLPGETKRIKIEHADGKPIALYFLFTTPGENWKYIVDEEGSNKVKVALGENEIQSVNVFK